MQTTETPLPVQKTPEELAAAAHHKLLDALRAVPEFYFAYKQLDYKDPNSFAPFLTGDLRSEKDCDAICGFIFQCYLHREKIIAALETAHEDKH